VLSALFFAISIPAYHSERIVTPLLCAALFLRFRKRFWQKEFLKYILVGGIVFIIVILPTVFIINTPGFFARVNDLNIMSVGRPAGILPDYHGFFSFLINNKILLNIREFLSLYVSYFSPRFIFVLGDSGPRSSFPELGTFFVWQAPFYLLGFYFILVKRLGELRYFLLSFLFISPITASLTRDPYSSTRALQMVIPLAVIIALGIIESYFYMRRWRLAGFRFLFGVIAAGFVIYSLLKLYSSVIVLNETYRGASWEYGWKEIAEIIKNLDSNYPVKVDSSRNVGYIELAFFMKADPKKYQLDNYEVSEKEYYTNLSMNSEKKIGRVTWGAIDWRNDLLQKQYLIGDSLAISDQQIKEHNLNLIREVYYKDGSLDLRVVETNPRR
jgi:hypothetical protein